MRISSPGLRGLSPSLRCLATSPRCLGPSLRCLATEVIASAPCFRAPATPAVIAARSESGSNRSGSDSLIAGGNSSSPVESDPSSAWDMMPSDLPPSVQLKLPKLPSSEEAHSSGSLSSDPAAAVCGRRCRVALPPLCDGSARSAPPPSELPALLRAAAG
eukprot:7308550-Prymnesium_polylepis.1